MSNSRQKNNQVPQTEKSSGNREDLLSRLPNEVLLNIIGSLLKSHHWDESEENRRKKSSQTITRSSGTKTITWLYQHNPEVPILTSFQAFSVLNRRTYSLCRPIMWQYLEFPSTLAGPMSFWMEEILPKHGSYVEVVNVNLRPEWGQESPRSVSIEEATREANQSPRSSHVNTIKFIEEDKDVWDVHAIHSDNLAVNDHDQQPPSLGLSPETLVRVLSHCEKLTTLHLNCPHLSTMFITPEQCYHLSDKLISLFSGISHLRHLRISSPTFSVLESECVSNTVTYLPLLESLELRTVGDEEGGDHGELATCLYNLKNLRRLVLHDVDTLDSSWGDRTGPPRLKNLAILNCIGLGLAKMPSFINSWAPRLTQLELRFSGDMDFESEEEFLAFKPDHNQCLLPALTNLTVWPRPGCQYIHCFSGCKDLCYLTFNYFIRTYSAPDKKSNYMLEEGSFEGLSHFSNFITRNHFPKLKVINLPVEEESLPLDSAVVSILMPLEGYCKSNGIELKIFFDRVSHSTFRIRDYQSVPLQRYK